MRIYGARANNRIIISNATGINHGPTGPISCGLYILFISQITISYCEFHNHLIFYCHGRLGFLPGVELA